MGISAFSGTPFVSITHDAIGSSRFETTLSRTKNSSTLIIKRAVNKGGRLETNLLLLLQDDSVLSCCLCAK